MKNIIEHWQSSILGVILLGGASYLSTLETMGDGVKVALLVPVGLAGLRLVLGKNPKILNGIIDGDKSTENQ